MMTLNQTNSGIPEPEMTSTAQEVVMTQNQPVPQKPTVDAKTKKRWATFKGMADTCKSYRRKLIANWSVSIDYRRGKPFASQTDDDQIAVNLDWSLTKTKQAYLFSQVPKVRVNHTPQTLPAGSPWSASFEQKLNDTLVEAGIESAMDECLPDCINAAGFGAVLVSYEAITEDVEVPAIDMTTLPPEVGAEALRTGMLYGEPVPMETVPNVVDRRYIVQRISPSDLLWPINFTGSNFDHAPMLGRTGRITWSEAVQKFKLKESDKDSIMGEDQPLLDKLTHDTERDRADKDEMVGFDEIFYKEFQYDPDSKSFSTIHHLVFVNGKDEPVIDEPWKGQRIDEKTGAVLGAQKLPIRILTLTYITDETIPPSDSAIGRPQVNEINKARTQMIKQRERSLPVRWFDVNRIDPTIQQSLMRGTWQAMIPVQGEGSRVIGEVARATMPQENFMFDKVAKSDLSEEWTIGPNQTGSGQEVETRGEANVIEGNFKVREGRERAKVSAFFVGIAEVLGGLLCLHEDPASFGEAFEPGVSRILKYSILADSTVLVDANQRLARLNQFIDMYAKSGWLNVEPILQEIATLTGLDPNTVIKPPQPKSPVEPNISLRLTGTEDMMNPLTLAFLIKSGQAPPPELIEQAKTLIQQAVVNPVVAPGQPPPTIGGIPPGPPVQEPQPGPPPGTPVPSPPPPVLGDANPQWSAIPKVNKRTEPDEG